MNKEDINNLENKILKPDVILFSFQVLLIFVVVCVSLLNLSLQWGNQNLWTVILTSSLGYIMPNPKLKEVIDVKASEVKTRPSF